MLRVLEVALGLALVFTLVSLAVSVLTEWISALWGRRSFHLRQALLRMLGDDTGEALCRHALVESLIPNRWLTNRHGPSYIPTDIFVTTLLAVLDPQGRGTTSQSGLLAQMEALPAENVLRQTLLPLIEQAGNDWGKVKSSVGAWFDRVMDEVSGWYKRWTQVVLFITGTSLAAVAGVDAIDITRSLWIDDEVRSGIATVATDFAQSEVLSEVLDSDLRESLLRDKTAELRQAQRALAAVGLPFRPIFHCSSTSELIACLFGYLLTGLAASLGAGFWFDLLKNLVRIRTAVSPPPSTQPPPATAADQDGGDGG